MNTCFPSHGPTACQRRFSGTSHDKPRYSRKDFDLWTVFNQIPDRRSKYGRRYPLPALLVIALAAMLCGRKNQASIARWARYLTPHELNCLGIRCKRAPCPATWCLFFQSLKAQDLEFCLGKWVHGNRRRGLGHVAIDGKYLRGSWEKEGRVTHLLAVFSDALQGVVATAPVPPGRTEICAMMEVLKRFPLPGAIITADAAFTRARVAKAITKGGGDYFLVVKGNHKVLRDNIAAAFHGIPHRDFFAPGVDQAEHANRGHGREEYRKIETIPAPKTYIRFPGAAQICRITRSRTTEGRFSEEVHYAVTSLSRKRGGNADYLLGLCRAHWSIENRLHWVRDVTLREDECRVRSQEAPQGMAALRNTCLTIIRRLGLRPVEGLEHFGRHPDRALSFLLPQGTA